MTYELIRRSTHKARKPHRCNWCHTPIEVGAKFIHEAGKYEGDFQVLRFHPECHDAIAKYLKETGETYVFLDEPFPRGEA